MSTYTAVRVPTQFVEANGIRFAYRRCGKRSGLPLVFNQHVQNMPNAKLILYPDANHGSWLSESRRLCLRSQSLSRRVRGNRGNQRQGSINKPINRCSRFGFGLSGETYQGEIQ